MEPNRLNTPPSGDDELDLLLRSVTRTDPVADDGFTARVMASLPAPGPARLLQGRVGASWRWLACLVGAAAGLGVFLLCGGSGLPSSLLAWDYSPEAAADLLGSQVLWIGIAAAALSLLFIYSGEVRRWWRRVQENALS